MPMAGRALFGGVPGARGREPGTQEVTGGEVGMAVVSRLGLIRSCVEPAFAARLTRQDA
jgi:hypothetical protein